MPLFRKQSAAEQTSLAPHDSKARLQNGHDSQGFMAKPCTPHLITRKGYATSVRQQSCQRLRSDVTEGFRPPESYPKNGIPQSASLTAPFNKGAKGRGLRIATASVRTGLAMTGFCKGCGASSGPTTQHLVGQGPCALPQRNGSFFAKAPVGPAALSGPRPRK